MIWNRVILLHRRLIQGGLQMPVRNITLSKILREEENDYYKALGVSRDATQAEIKNAYFQLSKIYHPDRIAATDENLTKFREISAAYEVLGNEHSRKLYDRGLDATKAPEDDPIVKFYQQRQRKSQVPVSDVDREELDRWTQEIYRAARKSSKQQNELFQATRIEDEEEEKKTAFFNFGLITSSIIVFMVLSSLEDNPVNVFFLQLFGDDNKKN